MTEDMKRIHSPAFYEMIETYPIGVTLLRRSYNRFLGAFNIPCEVVGYTEKDNADNGDLRPLLLVEDMVSYLSETIEVDLGDIERPNPDENMV